MKRILRFLGRVLAIIGAFLILVSFFFQGWTDVPFFSDHFLPFPKVSIWEMGIADLLIGWFVIFFSDRL